MKKNNLQEHHEETFGKDESYETFVNEIKSGIRHYAAQFTNLFKKLCRGIFPRFPDTVYCYAKYYFEEYEDDFESLDINEKFLRDNKFI